jgi:threonine/homoserine/homoserine lactone efflux protein
MSLEVFTIYFFVAFFYIISPGPAIFLAINNGLTKDMKTVAISSFANILGLFILSAISISGLGAILTASASLFMMVKIIGAFYLLYLGVKQFRSIGSIQVDEQNTYNHNKRSSKVFFYESFFLAVTNPKPIVFFIALFPQFLTLEKAILPQFFILTGTFMFISFFSLFTYGYISKNAKRYFNDKVKMAWFHRITGGLFIMMGLGLLQLKRVQ